MSRLPNLERALLDAAERLDAAQPQPTSPREQHHRRRWPRRGTPLLAGLVSLILAGAAVAAATGLLAQGDPVPDGPNASNLHPDTPGFTLTSQRAPDPDGGPAWALGTFSATESTVPGAAPADIAAQFRQHVTCLVVGRVQAGQLGVVGRDGVFHNDGRFHALTPRAQTSGVCGGGSPHASLTVFGYGPPVPASGYSGPPGTAIGGCRERVNLNGPTVSPQTRRKLKDVPQCSVASLRRVISGFAGPNATHATYTDTGYRKTITLDPKQNGAYLFVVRSASHRVPQLEIADNHGHTCHPLLPFPGNPSSSNTTGLRACEKLTG